MNFRIESKIGEEIENISELSPSEYLTMQKKGELETSFSSHPKEFFDDRKNSSKIFNSKPGKKQNELRRTMDLDIYYVQDGNGNDEVKVDTIYSKHNQFNIPHTGLMQDHNEKGKFQRSSDGVQVEAKGSCNLERKASESSIYIGNGKNVIKEKFKNSKTVVTYHNHSKITNIGYSPSYTNESHGYQNGSSKNSNDSGSHKANGNNYGNNASNSYSNKQSTSSIENGHSHSSNNNGKGYSPPKSILPERNASLIEWENLRFLIMDSPKDSNLELYIRTAQYYNVTDMVRVCEEMYDKRDVEKAGIKVHEMTYDDGDFAPRAVIDQFLDLVAEVFFNPNSRQNLQSTWNGVKSFTGHLHSQSNTNSSPNNLTSSSSYSSINSTPISNASTKSTNSHMTNLNTSSTIGGGEINQYRKTANYLSNTTTSTSSMNMTTSTLSSTGFSPPSHKVGSSRSDTSTTLTQKPCIAVHCIAGLGRAPVLVALALIEYGFGDADRVVAFIRQRRKNAINMRQLQNIQEHKRRGHANDCACTIM